MLCLYTYLVLNVYLTFYFEDGVIATQYIGDLPVRPLSTFLTTPPVNVSVVSCLSFVYATISSVDVYGKYQNGSMFKFKECRSADEQSYSWVLFFCTIFEGIYSIVWENQLSTVSLKARNFTSGVIYPFIMNDMVITPGYCQINNTKSKYFLI